MACGAIESDISTIGSTANTTFNLDFYSNPACDSSGNGEGQTYLGSATVMTGSNCIADFSGANRIMFTSSVTVPPGQIITSTATDLAGNTSEFSQCPVSPTAASATISGRIAEANGRPVEGVAIRMAGTQNRLTITGAEGTYHFDNVETGGVYTVTPSRANYNFSPSQATFSQLGNHTEATFTASLASGGGNPLDTATYFVRQQYLDFLNREPDEAGFNFWVDKIEACGSDANTAYVDPTIGTSNGTCNKAAPCGSARICLPGPLHSRERHGPLSESAGRLIPVARQQVFLP